jgi:hypothetical protein
MCVTYIKYLQTPSQHVADCVAHIYTYTIKMHITCHIAIYATFTSSINQEEVDRVNARTWKKNPGW